MGWVFNATLWPLYLQEKEGWVAPGPVRKTLPLPGFDPRTVQPVSSRYTDYAILAPPYFKHVCNFCLIKVFLDCTT
jgi:hypothetical protein